jgi:hypothetical protein
MIEDNAINVVADGVNVTVSKHRVEFTGVRRAKMMQVEVAPEKRLCHAKRIAKIILQVSPSDRVAVTDRSEAS